MTNTLSQVAAGETQLREFVVAWRAYVEEHGLPWPEPSLHAENGLAVARFMNQRVSVSHWSSRARVANVAEWMTSEAEVYWTPVTLTDDLECDVALKIVADVLDRRIPW